MGGNSSAVRRRFWRFAGSWRLAGTLFASVAMAACAAARPNVGLPAPRSAPTTIAMPRTDSVEPAPSPTPTSVVWGDIRFAPSGGPAVDLGATVVYLRTQRRASSLEDRGSTVLIVSRSPEFAPPLTVVRTGQRIVFVNDGLLVHRLFSPGLGDATFAMEPGGRSDSLSIGARGPTRFFCSLHAEEAFVVFAEDASHMAVVSDGGAYRFAGVAPGRYTLEIWSERVAGAVREVLVDGYTRTRQRIVLFANLIAP